MIIDDVYTDGKTKGPISTLLKRNGANEVTCTRQEHSLFTRDYVLKGAHKIMSVADY